MHSLRIKKKKKKKDQQHLVLKSLPLHYSYHDCPRYWPTGACPVHSHKDDKGTEAAATGEERTNRESEEDLISVYKYWRGRENKYPLSGQEVTNRNSNALNIIRTQGNIFSLWS